MLVGAVDRRVDRYSPVHHAAVASIGQQGCQEAIPGASTAIAAVPFPQRLPGLELRRHIPPGDPAPIPVDNALDHSTVDPKRATGPTSRQRKLGTDERPLGVIQNSRTRHLSIRTAGTTNDEDTRSSRAAFRDSIPVRGSGITDDTPGAARCNPASHEDLRSPNGESGPRTGLTRKGRRNRGAAAARAAPTSRSRGFFPRGRARSSAPLRPRCCNRLRRAGRVGRSHRSSPRRGSSPLRR